MMVAGLGEALVGCERAMRFWPAPVCRVVSGEMAREVLWGMARRWKAGEVVRVVDVDDGMRRRRERADRMRECILEVEVS